MHAQTVAEMLVDQMVEAGIRNVYGIVGDSANPIVDAMRRHTAEINFVHVRNEEAGAFAAGADAQVSGRPTAVLGSSGPGSVHLLNGLYDCQRNGAPVFAIATHIPSTQIGTGYFQETQPEQIFAGCCNYVAMITSPDQMPRLSELALQAAILERGVGMVILPGDVGAAEVDQADAQARDRHRAPADPPDRCGAGRGRGDHRGRRRGSRSTAARGRAPPATRCSSSRRTLQAPIGYAYRGKDVLEHDNPAAVGMTGLLGWGGATQRDAASATCCSCSAATSPTTCSCPSGPKIIQVDDSSSHLGRRANIALGLVGDVGETLRALLPRLTARTDSAFLDDIVEHHHDRRSRTSRPTSTHQGSRRGAATRDGRRDAQRAGRRRRDLHRRHRHVQRLGRALPRHEAGRRILASFGHGSMANAMPQAIGAKVGSPDRQVIALCGDGGFSMLMGELLTAAGLDIPVKLMVFNNSTLGMVRAEMMVVGYEPFGTDVKNPDFGALATAAGIHGERVEQPRTSAARSSARSTTRAPR